MQITVNESACVGVGQCAMVAGELFDQAVDRGGERRAVTEQRRDVAERHTRRGVVADVSNEAPKCSVFACHDPRLPPRTSSERVGGGGGSGQ